MKKTEVLLFAVFSILSVANVNAQLPKLNTFYDGYSNYQCASSTGSDSAGLNTQKARYVYGPNGLPDSMFLETKEPGDITSAFIVFTYFPSQLYYISRWYSGDEKFNLFLYIKTHYNSQGVLTEDSCFDGNNRLSNYSKYHYRPDGKISMKTAKNIPPFISFTCDTLRWIYTGAGRIDSVKGDWRFEGGGVITEVDIFLPQYDANERITGAVEYVGNPNLPLLKMNYIYTYSNNAIKPVSTSTYGNRNFITVRNNQLYINYRKNFSRDGIVHYEIFDCLGKVLFQSKQLNIPTGSSSLSQRLSGTAVFPSGRYILQIHNRTETVKFPFSIIR
jgi:hypothetical protein